MGKHVLAVFTNPAEGRDDEYNDWYNNVHLKDLLSIPGIVSAQRFVYGEQRGEPGPWRYLALYQIDAESIEAAQDALAESAAKAPMQISPALDRSATVSWYFTPITDSVTL